MKIDVDFLNGGAQSGRRGIIMITFLLLLGAMVIGLMAYFSYGFAEYQATGGAEYLQKALYLAEAGIDSKMVELMQANTNDLRQNLGDGSFVATYGSQNVNGALEEWIDSTGTVAVNGRNYSKTVRSWLQRTQVSNNVRAAVTANGDVWVTGSIIVDGREHDINGNLTGDPGLFGISASEDFGNNGNAQIGGLGFAPSKNPDPRSIEEHGQPVPATPDSFLGLPEGTLQGVAIDSLPASRPYRGIIYLDESAGAVDLSGITGIVICHNSAGNASLGNVHGNFKGLILTDTVHHINGGAEILGAFVGLGSGGIDGNGNAKVLYSSAILADLPLRKYKVSAWQDSSNNG